MDKLPNQRLYTRPAAIKRLNEDGIPVPKSALDKERAAGRGPQPACFYGKRELFTEEKVLRWGATLIAPKPVRLNAALAEHAAHKPRKPKSPEPASEPLDAA